MQTVFATSPLDQRKQLPIQTYIGLPETDSPVFADLNVKHLFISELVKTTILEQDPPLGVQKLQCISIEIR